MVITNPILQLKKVSISYTPGKNAVEEVSADIAEKKITAMERAPCYERSTECTNYTRILKPWERFS